MLQCLRIGLALAHVPALTSALVADGVADRVGIPARDIQRLGQVVVVELGRAHEVVDHRQVDAPLSTGRTAPLNAATRSEESAAKSMQAAGLASVTVR